MTADLPQQTAERVPKVTVMMCTRNRQENLLPAVQAVLACDYDDFELIVLDQSDDRSTSDALKALRADDHRLGYVRLDFAGKPRALNVGLSLGRGEYFLLTDDDCEPEAGWINAMVGAMREDPTLGCVFGDVSAVEHDLTQGYIPVCRIERRAKITRLADFVPVPPRGLYGMGANMGFPASALRTVGGWDPCIGPGARFGSGDDMDMSVRILRADYAIGFLPESRVLHYGMRKWSSGWNDRQRTGFGLGAIFAKHLRSGAIFNGALAAMAQNTSKALMRAIRRERHIGIAYPIGWLKGVGTGLRYPLDRTSNQFVLGSDSSVKSHGDQFASIEFGMSPSLRNPSSLRGSRKFA